MKVKEKKSINSEEMELDKPKVPSQFEPESMKVPDELPVLGLKDVVVFPQMVTALGISTEQELKLLDNVLSTNRFLALVAHKVEAEEKLKPTDLYEYGTASVVLQMLRMPDNTAKMLVQGIARRLFKLFFRIGDDIAAFLFLIIEARPGDRVVFFTNAKKAAKAHHAEHDVVRGLVEHDVFDFTDLVACRIINRRADDARGANGGCVSCCCRHSNSPFCR